MPIGGIEGLQLDAQRRICLRPMCLVGPLLCIHLHQTVG